MTKTEAKPARRPRRLRMFIFFMLAAFVGLAAGVAIYAMTVILPNVPKIDAVLDYQPKIPLRVYTADRHLIGEFGVERRDFVTIDKIPTRMKQALLYTRLRAVTLRACKPPLVSCAPRRSRRGFPCSPRWD